MHIEARNLVKAFKKRVVVNNVSLKVEKSEIVGFKKPDSGEIFISDVNISKLPNVLYNSPFKNYILGVRTEGSELIAY